MFRKWFGRGKTQPSVANGTYRHGNSHLIELRQVIKTYQSAAGDFTALKGVDLLVDRGEFVAIIGKSGSGKSTLINMVAGIDRPSSGDVLVGDTAVHTLSESRMAEWRGRNLGIVFQFFQLLPALSLIENVMLPMDFCNMFEPRERRERALQLLAQVDMADQADKLPSAVSGGQQQRVAIARALANDPPIVIADEPTGNLDSKTAEQVFDLFDRLVQQGKTVMMVTHDNGLAKRATRAVIVSDGEIVNEYVVQALPSLNLDQLAWVTQQLAPHHYEPGAVIMQEGEPADRFYIILKGTCDVCLHHPDGQEVVVSHMYQGQYFGEVGLLREGKRTATIRAADNVEAVGLDREAFARLMSESPATREAISRVATERVSDDAEQLEQAAPVGEGVKG